MIEVNLNKVIEALLFVSEKPLTIKQITEVCPKTTPSQIKKVLTQLKELYSAPERGVQIIEVAGGYQFCSDPECEPYLSKLYRTKRVFRLSAPALETLAIVAYRQPVTRAEMEFIRGVNVDGVIKNLEDRELVKTKGRKEVAGRPMLYGTTDKFLHNFGLNSLQEMPSLEEFAATALEKESQIKQDKNFDEQDAEVLNSEQQNAEADLKLDGQDEDLDLASDKDNDENNAEGDLGENLVQLDENIEDTQEAEDNKVDSSEQVQTQTGDACHEKDEHSETANSN